MEEFNFNDTKSKNILHYINMILNYSNTHYSSNFIFLNYANWITIGIGLPLTLIVMIAVCSQVKKDHGAPVYVINLLVSDLIQLCCRTPFNIPDLSISSVISILITCFGAMVSVGFMMCISCERYLVIARPLWYRFRRNIKTYVVVCVVVWALPLLFLLISFLVDNFKIGLIFCICFLLLPFPLFIFFLVGTIKVLSGALSVPADEKRQIAAIQVVVLLIYTLLYLPIIVLLLDFIGISEAAFDFIPLSVGLICVCLSPLADTTFYLLIRKSIMDKFLASLCSCKISNNQEMSSTEQHGTRTATNTETG